MRYAEHWHGVPSSHGFPCFQTYDSDGLFRANSLRILTICSGLLSADTADRASYRPSTVGETDILLKHNHALIDFGGKLARDFRRSI